MVMLILHKMAFYYPDEVVTLHLDNSIAIAYFCSQCGTVSIFQPRLASSILSMANKHGITLITALYLPTSLLKLIICHDRTWFKNDIFLHSSCGISTLL